MPAAWIVALFVSATVTSADLGVSRVEPFTLKDYRGTEHRLSDYRDQKAIVVVFLGTECPLVKLYASRLSDLHDRFSAQGVTLLGINSNRHDSITEIAHYARKHALPFPILKDVGNKVADQFGAERTPEVFVLDQSNAIQYRGRIDDQYGVGYSRTDVGREDLALAVEQVLAGKPVEVPRTEAVGCIIGRVPEKDPTGNITYTKQVSRILKKRCVECHREGQIAPFSLTSYEDVVGWGETIVEVVEDQRMPPWHANPQYGEFSNDCRMTDEEKAILAQWVENGAPQGDPKDLPEPLEFAKGWRIPTPDLVISMPKVFTVPAEGVVNPKTGKPSGQVPYKYFVAEHEFKEDTWVQAAEAKPGNPSVVHHIIVFVKGPQDRASHGELRSDWLVATAPGAMPLRLPDGMAKKIPAGSRLVFQMHYTPNGTEQEDLSSVGLVLADPEKVEKQVATDKAATHRFTIPPNADNHRVDAKRTFDKDVLLLAMFPHMHLRGKSFRYIAKYPDKREEILLDVPRYDFNWQNAYVLAEPKRLPSGTTLHCVAHFDNSDKNLANPDPNQSVRWGDQTWEEMMIGYIDIALADQDLTQLSRTEQFEVTDAQIGNELTKGARGSLQSSDSFGLFAKQLQQIVPQLDRLCITSVEGEDLLVEHEVHSSHVSKEIAPAGFKAKTAGFAIARHANSETPVVHENLAKAPGLDLRTMSRVYRSSLHVPVRLGDKKGTVNFWSTEPDAFPEPAVELLTKVAGEMTR